MKYFHTIGSGIVRDALHCLAKNHLPQSYIGGGMSLQFTLPEDLHRDTSDIDLSTAQHMTGDDFRAYVSDTFEDLVDRGYTMNVAKRRNTLDAHLEREDSHLMVQIPRRNAQNFERRRSILEREVEHTRAIPYAGMSLLVISYEDLVAHKIMRSSTFVTQYNLKEPQAGNLEDTKEKLNELKNEFSKTSYTLEPQEAARTLAQIRLLADVFDITAILTYFHDRFDEHYFHEALGSFRESKEKQDEWLHLLEEIQG